jgi:hypothetical protein
VKRWIRISITVKIEALSRLNTEPWRAVDAQMETWRLKMEAWRVCRPIVAGLHHLKKEQDPDPHLKLCGLETLVFKTVTKVSFSSYEVFPHKAIVRKPRMQGSGFTIFQASIIPCPVLTYGLRTVFFKGSVVI